MVKETFVALLISDRFLGSWPSTVGLWKYCSLNILDGLLLKDVVFRG